MNGYILTLPLLIAFVGGLWLLYRYQCRRLILRGQQEHDDSPLIQLKLAQTATVFHVDDHARGLRQRVNVQSNRLDPERTVNATIRNSGLFKRINQKKFHKPDYVILLDHRFRKDHVTYYFRSFIERLKQQKIRVTLYEYRGDPRKLYELDEYTSLLSKPLKLQNLPQRHPHARLLITGIGESLFHPFSGEAYSWVQCFNDWQTKVWLTPKPQPWGHREHHLVETGFTLAAFIQRRA